MSRLNNSHVCVVCARRSDGLAVGKPGELGWFCHACGSTRARTVIYMAGIDQVERDACRAVAEEACGGQSITLTPDELPAFIGWAIEAFAESMRKQIDE